MPRRTRDVSNKNLRYTITPNCQDKGGSSHSISQRLQCIMLGTSTSTVVRKKPNHLVWWLISLYNVPINLHDFWHSQKENWTAKRRARSYDASAAVFVCNGLAHPADAACRMDCEICKVIRYVAATVWRRFECSLVSMLPCPWYNFAINVVSSSVGGSDYIEIRSAISIRAKRDNADVGAGRRDNGTN